MRKPNNIWVLVANSWTFSLFHLCPLVLLLQWHYLSTALSSIPSPPKHLQCWRWRCLKILVWPKQDGSLSETWPTFLSKYFPQRSTAAFYHFIHRILVFNIDRLNQHQKLDFEKLIESKMRIMSSHWVNWTEPDCKTQLTHSCDCVGL